jgi:hypothetical protein
MCVAVWEVPRGVNISTLFHGENAFGRRCYINDFVVSFLDELNRRTPRD